MTVDIAWRHPSRRNRPSKLRGILTCLVACIVGISYTIFLLPLAWPLLPLPTIRVRELYRRWIMTVQLLYFGLIGGLVEILCKIRLVITGSEELRDGYLERPLIISNMGNGLDALSLICLCLRLRRLSTLKFIVDESWRKVPVIGWAMQMMLFPFVGRQRGGGGADEKMRKADRSSLRHHIEYLAAFNDSEGITLAIYPEAYADSDEKSSESDDGESRVPRYTSGVSSGLLTIAIDALRTFNAIDCCLDVTTATVNFQPFERPDIYSILKGRFPREIHMCVTRYHWSEVPSRRDHVKDWIADRFETKEEMLQRFYSPLQVLLNAAPGQEMSSEESSLQAGDERTIRLESSSSSLLGNSDEEAVSITSNTSSVVDQLDPALWFSEAPGESPMEEVLSKEMKFVQYAYTSYMLCFVVALVVHLLIGVVFVRAPGFVICSAAGICTVYALVTVTVGGFDILELEVWPRKRNVVLPSDGPLAYGSFIGGSSSVANAEEYTQLSRGGYEPTSTIWGNANGNKITSPLSIFSTRSTSSSRGYGNETMMNPAIERGRSRNRRF